jgi:hypothetical protein
MKMTTADADGDTLSYSATGLPSGLTINSSTGMISGMIGFAAYVQSPYQVTVTASDGSHSAGQSFVWTVTQEVALSNPGSQADAKGDTVSLQVHATGLAGGTLSYSASGLPSGLSINSSTGLISGTISATGTYSVTVNAGDGSATSSQSFSWAVTTLYLPTPADQTNFDGDSVSLSLAANYHGSGTLTYSVTGLPTGLSINSSTGLVSGTVGSTADTGGPYSVTVTVTDGTNTASQSFNWNINPVVTVTSPGDQANAVGDAVDVTTSATDGLNNTLTYSASGLPGGLSINTSTGEITGTLSVGDDATSPDAVTVTASDGTWSASQSFNWDIAHLSLVNPGLQESVDGQNISLAIVGGDADGGTVTFSASGLPPGLSINSATGVISGALASNADANSGYLASVTISDGSHTATQTFQWDVAKIGIANPGDQTSQEGHTVSLSLTALGSPSSPTYTATGLPNGLSINSSTGVIAGTIAPGAAANGPFTVTVAITSGSISGTTTFTWTVNPVVSVTVIAEQTSAEGASISIQASATDANSSTLTYSATGLPAGLSINAGTGLISGIISTGDASAGPDYSVTVTASDGTYSTSVTFNWHVTNPHNTAPTLTNPGDQSDQVGDNVDFFLTASDADGDPLTFDATGLPDGLYLDPSTGELCGTLAEDSASSAPQAVTVTVDDGQGGIVSQTFHWTVNAASLTASVNSVSAVEGQDTGAITVATFTTPDLNSQAGDYTATINWGDGDTQTGLVLGGAGSFIVVGNHTSFETATSNPVSVACLPSRNPCHFSGLNV